MKDIQIVPATAWDVSALMVLLEEMQQGLEIEQAPVNALKAAYHLLNTIRDGVILMAVDDAGEIAGAIGLRFEEYWWSDIGLAVDDFFFVSKDERKGGVASKLLTQAIALCTDKGIALSVGHQMSQLDKIEVKDKFYESLGFVKTGSFFVLGDQHGKEQDKADDKQQ